MDPVFLEIANIFSLSWYGVLVVGGAILCAWIAAQYAGRADERKDHIWNLLGIVLIFGIIGARLYHVVSAPTDGGGWPFYRNNPDEIWNFWNGGLRGLGIFGGIAGGAIGVFLYCAIRRLDPIKYLDFIAPTVLLGQAIGRVGNYINQELYGPITDLPWAFHINPQYPCQPPIDLPAAVQGCGITSFIPGELTAETLDWYASTGFHPTFFYEAIWNLLGFIAIVTLIRIAGPRLRRGDAVLIYLLVYAVGRLWVEIFRPDAWMWGPLAVAQWISLGLILVCGWLLVARHRGWDGASDPAQSLSLMSGRRSTQ